LEEIFHKRLDGVSVSYRIAIGPSGKQKVVDLTRVDGEVYGSLDEIRQIMVDKLTVYVNELCEQTQAKVQAWYGVQLQQQGNVMSNNNGDKVDPAELLNQVSNPNFHSQQGYTTSTMNPNSQPVYVKQPSSPNGLRNQMADPELLQRDVMMEDGSVQKITMNTNPKS